MGKAWSEKFDLGGMKETDLRHRELHKFASVTAGVIE